MSVQDGDVFERSRNTWAIYGLVGYFAYLEASLGPIVPFLRREQDFGFTAASFHFSAFAAGALVVGILADRIAARYGRGFGLWGGGMGMALGAVGLALGPWALVTVGAAFVMGLFGSLLLIMTQSVLADRHGPWRTVAITESNVAASAAAVLASLAVGAAAGALDWRAAVIPPIVAVVALFAGFRRETLGETRVASRRRDGRALPLAFWIYWGVLFLGVAAEWSIGFWGPEFLTASLALSPSGAATAMSLFFVAMLSGRVLSSRLARLLDDRTLLVGTLCLASAGFLLLWLSRAPLPGLGGLFLTGLGLAGVYPVGLSAGVSTVPRATDTAAARLGVAAATAIFLLPLIVGRIADSIGIIDSFGLVAPLLVAAIALTALDRWWHAGGPWRGRPGWRARAGRLRRRPPQGCERKSTQKPP